MVARADSAGPRAAHTPATRPQKSPVRQIRWVLLLLNFWVDLPAWLPASPGLRGAFNHASICAALTQ